MQRRRSTIDDSKPVWQSLLVFLVPLLLANTVQSAGQTFSGIFLGRMIGVKALAAGSSVFPLLFLLISFFIGISSGATVLIGQAYGARDEAKLIRVAGTTLTFATGLGILIAIIGFFFAEPILQLIGTPADIFAGAVAYARVIFLTMPFVLIYFAYTAFLRGIGDSQTPFIALIGTTALSIAMTPMLIAGWFGLPVLGLVAAPVANGIATAISIVGLLVYLERRHHPLAFGRLRGALAIEVDLLITLVRIGVPTSIQLIMVSLSEIAVISFVNHFGSSATAAYGAVNQIASYVQFPAISIGIASSIFGAQAIGARRLDRIAKIVRAGVALNYAIGGALIVLVYLLASPILGLFITDPKTHAVALELLQITLWSYVIFGNAAVLSGIMRSSGTVLWPTAISVGAIWLVEVPVAYTLSHGPLGLRGVWYAYPIAFAVSLAFQTAYYLLVWRKRPIPSLLTPSTGALSEGAS
jgi:putative MATE family efflux protein